MKKLIIPILFIAAMFTSCLENNLPELPVFHDAEVLDFKFEFRYIDEETNVLEAKPISSPAAIDTLTNTIDIEFKSSIKKYFDQGLSMQTLVGYATISAGATIKPVDDAPILGVPSDYSAGTYEYEVIAADGETSRIWTLNLESFE